MSSMNGRLDDLEGGGTFGGTFDRGRAVRRIRPVSYAREEDVRQLAGAVEQLGEVVDSLAARQAVLEQALTSVIADVYDAGAEEPEENVYANGETDEELDPGTQARIALEQMRGEDIERVFEAANEHEAAMGINDVTDVPEEGNPVE